MTLLDLTCSLQAASTRAPSTRPPRMRPRKGRTASRSPSRRSTLTRRSARRATTFSASTTPPGPPRSSLLHPSGLLPHLLPSYIPRWMSVLLPTSAVTFLEDAYSCYPYSKTSVTNAFLGERLIFQIEGVVFEGNVKKENPLGLESVPSSPLFVPPSPHLLPVLIASRRAPRSTLTFRPSRTPTFPSIPPQSTCSTTRRPPLAPTGPRRSRRTPRPAAPFTRQAILSLLSHSLPLLGRHRQGRRVGHPGPHGELVPLTIPSSQSLTFSGSPTLSRIS